MPCGSSNYLASTADDKMANNKLGSMWIKAVMTCL